MLPASLVVCVRKFMTGNVITCCGEAAAVGGKNFIGYRATMLIMGQPAAVLGMLTTDCLESSQRWTIIHYIN